MSLTTAVAIAIAAVKKLPAAAKAAKRPRSKNPPSSPTQNKPTLKRKDHPKGWSFFVGLLDICEEVAFFHYLNMTTLIVVLNGFFDFSSVSSIRICQTLVVTNN